MFFQGWNKTYKSDIFRQSLLTKTKVSKNEDSVEDLNPCGCAKPGLGAAQQSTYPAYTGQGLNPSTQPYSYSNTIHCYGLNVSPKLHVRNSIPKCYMLGKRSQTDAPPFSWADQWELCWFDWVFSQGPMYLVPGPQLTTLLQKLVSPLQAGP